MVSELCCQARARPHTFEFLTYAACDSGALFRTLINGRGVGVWLC